MTILQVDPNPLHLPRLVPPHQVVVVVVSEEALATEVEEGADSGAALETEGVVVIVEDLGDVVGLAEVDEVGMVVIVGMVTEEAVVTVEGLAVVIVEDLVEGTVDTVVRMVRVVGVVDMVAVIGADMVVETEVDLEVVEDSETR